MVLPKQDPVSLSDLPQPERDRCMDGARWYAARNAEDGAPKPPAPWTKDAVIRRVAEVHLALGLWAGQQRTPPSLTVLASRLAAAHRREAELRLRADAGAELAHALSTAAVTSAQALLLSHPGFSQAETSPIPTQRVSA